MNDGETELADKVSLWTELAEAHGVITSKDGEIEDLRSELNEAKTE